MSVTITLPDPLSERLQNEAQARSQSAEALAVELLNQALTDSSDQELAALIARIRATPPNPANQFVLEPGMQSLTEYLSSSLASEDLNEEFDLEEWQRNWNAVEAGMKGIDRANDIAEGLE
ncbi:MAG: hypothetical protein U0Z53_04310 [Blastocatellia bacterium]